MKNNSYCIKIPTKPHIRKFCEKIFPRELSFKNNFGAMVICLLENQAFTVKQSEKWKEDRLITFTDEIVLTAPRSTFRWRGSDLNRDKIVAINSYLDAEFRRELFYYCQLNISRDNKWRPGIDQALFSFAASYGLEIDVDITFEALKQTEYRYRKKAAKTLV